MSSSVLGDLEILPFVASPESMMGLDTSLLKHPLAHTSPHLIAHELCHVWQDQDHRLRMWWSYLAQGYADNPHEREAREAGAAAQ